MARVLGIDSGINGGCALYCSDSIVPTVPQGIFDIPTIGEGNQREIDYAGLRDLIFAVRPDCVVIEIVNAFMPTREGPGGAPEKVQWGGTSLFRFGGSYYAIHAVVACLDLPRHRVSSAAWKGHFGLKGKKKGSGIDDSARQVVLRRFPSLHPFLTKKGDQHRAEAFLMAVWFAETGGRPKKQSRKLAPAVAVTDMDDELFSNEPADDDIPE
jgi:hypothetical protein